MIIHQGIDGLRELPPGSVMSIGNFDGVHRGHLRIVEMARELRADREGGRIALVTFEPHPLTVLRPEKAPPRLTPPALKRSLLAAVGVDDLVVLPPTRDVLNLTAEQFWAILRDHARPSHLIEGDSFNFGKDRGGTIERLREWCAQSDIQLHVAEAVQVALLDFLVTDVNSSLLRWLLANGRARDAAICLGRPYTLSGTVVEGFKRGRSIGVPTANLQVDDQLVPADGVYAARCKLDHADYAAAVSIGTLPTFGNPRRQIEAHLIGFDADLYGRSLSLDLIDWLREQRKFPGVDALKEQLSRDIDVVARRASIDPSRPIASVMEPRN
jgi:riboflavin kinase/FMN adenylyltransferase